MKKISVIIPVYNVEKYVERCVKSVLRQNYSNLQIILINDGSTDLSGNICDYLAEQDERIVVIHQPNRGVSVARNEGIKRCSGEYFCFLDSDDAFAPEILNQAVEKIESDDSDVVIFGWKKIFGNGREEQWTPVETGILHARHVVKQLLYNFSEFGGGYPNKLWKSRVFTDSIPRYDEKLTYFEDSEWMTRMFLKINKISVLDNVGYLYYIRNDSTTFKSGVEEQREYGYHMSMLKIIEDLNEDKELQSWFATKYAIELINGCVHAKRKNWRELQYILEAEVYRKRYELLKNSNLSIKTKLRCLFILVRKGLRSQNESKKTIDN